jgi:cyclomaltodextrinase / maltogenic alpha-amylase / neopullulanase
MILHDSHSPVYREPLGPVPAGGSLRLRFTNDEGDAVTLRTWDGTEKCIPMARNPDGLYEITLKVPEAPMLFWYDFIVARPEGDVKYGNAADELGGVGEPVYGAPRSYQVTVYDPAFHTPPYLREGVCYQVFPDRFYRLPEDAPPERSQLVKQAHPEAAFHASWQEPPALDLDPENGDNRALDFFGGTLKGIAEKLDTLRDLGVTVLYKPRRARPHQPPLRYGRLHFSGSHTGVERRFFRPHKSGGGTRHPRAVRWGV